MKHILIIKHILIMKRPLPPFPCLMPPFPCLISPVLCPRSPVLYPLSYAPVPLSYIPCLMPPFPCPRSPARRCPTAQSSGPAWSSPTTPVSAVSVAHSRVRKKTPAGHSSRNPSSHKKGQGQWPMIWMYWAPMVGGNDGDDADDAP